MTGQVDFVFWIIVQAVPLDLIFCAFKAHTYPHNISISPLCLTVVCSDGVNFCCLIWVLCSFNRISLIVHFFNRVCMWLIGIVAYFLYLFRVVYSVFFSLADLFLNILLSLDRRCKDLSRALKPINILLTTNRSLEDGFLYQPLKPLMSTCVHVVRQCKLLNRLI